MIICCFDLGNTRQKAAIFEDNTLQQIIYLDSNELLKNIQEIISHYKVTHSILSSVINHDAAIENYLQQHTVFKLLNAQSKLPFTTPVGKPETIGADRLAICAAAVNMYPNHHKLAIGLGTCITYNYINTFNEFLGGSISPGMHMRFKAMNQQTALLPIVPAEHDIPLIGYDTKTNLQSGVLLGMAKEIEGVIKLYEQKFEDIKIILTGGDSTFFKHHIDANFVYEEHLVFKGLLAIGQGNF